MVGRLYGNVAAACYAALRWSERIRRTLDSTISPILQVSGDIHRKLQIDDSSLAVKSFLNRGLR
jgi:hypothetical protein